MCMQFPYHFFSSFWGEHLTLNLSFKDEAFEKKYIKAKSSFTRLNLRLLCIILLILMSGNFFANPFTVDLFQLMFILPFIAAVALLILVYLFITKPLREKSQLAFSITVLVFVIGSGETVINVLGTSDWTPSLFWVLATHFQTASLIIIIARLGSSLCTLLILIIQTYMWLLLYRVSGQGDSFTPSLITFIVYLIALPIMSYCGELEDRRMFFEVMKRETNLGVFNHLIREVIPSSIILLDKEKILFSNEKFKEIFGVEKEDELVSLLTTIDVKYWRDFNPYNLFKIISEKKKVFQEKNSLFTNKNRGDSIEEEKKRSLYEVIKEWRGKLDLKTVSNSFVFYEARQTLNSNSNGERTFGVQIGVTLWESKISIMIIINDISAVKDYYRELGEHKDQLLATVSHELRTPLNGILGMIDMSLENSKDNTVIAHLEVMQKSGKLLLNMINDILDFSLISKNKLRLNISLVNVVKLIDETLKILEMQAKMKGIALEFEQNVANPYIKTDPSRLQQIILNLVGNAIKFTFQGSVKIRLRETNNNDESIDQHLVLGDDPSKCEKVQHEEGEVSLPDGIQEDDVPRVYIMEFEDTGIGIAKEDQSGIFKLFGRLDQINKNINQKGVGLGLAISEQLVCALNRNKNSSKGISLISQPGKGSLFFFKLHVYSTHSNVISSEENLDLPVFHNDPIVTGPIPFCCSRKLVLESEKLAPCSLDINQNIINLLAVDDDQINLIVIKNYVESASSVDKIFKLTTANNGKEAVEIVKAYSNKDKYFQAILMDCNMPIMDGYEASRTLKDMMFKGIIPEAPIIAITANADHGDTQNCFRSGMSYYLVKPLKKKTLIDTIEKSLNEKGKDFSSAFSKI